MLPVMVDMVMLTTVNVYQAVEDDGGCVCT